MTERDIDLETLKSEIAEKGQEFLGKAVEFARERPHVAVGIAFGVGWILGNGVSPRLLMGAARIGWRSVLGGALAGTGLMGALSGTDAGGESTVQAAGSKKASRESSSVPTGRND